METSRCCKSLVVEDEGYMYCTMCGVRTRRYLETSVTSFNQSTFFMPVGYTRRSRFIKKIIGSLRLMTTHEVQPELVDYLRTKNIQTPQQLLNSMTKFKTKKRSTPTPWSTGNYWAKRFRNAATST